MRGGAPSRGPSDAGADASGAVAEDGPPAFGSPIVPGPREVLEASGAWDAVAAQIAAGPQRDRRSRTGAGSGRRAKAQLDPIAEVGQAREELGTKPEQALLRLALVLRADPTLAPAILDAISLRREPAAALLRGDAERLLGRHLEAEAAFDVAAGTLEP